MAVVALTEEGYARKTYDLNGPELLDMMRINGRDLLIGGLRGWRKTRPHSDCLRFPNIAKRLSHGRRT